MVHISEDFIQDRVEELKTREDVLAVGVVGSYARSPDEDHNDLDIFVIVDGNWIKRKTEVVKGVPVEYFFNSMEKAKEWLKKEEWWKNYHWYTNCNVIYDPEEKFNQLKKEAERVKQDRVDLDDENLEEMAYEIWDAKKDLETDDVSQKRYMLNTFFDKLIQMHYLLEGEVPVKKNFRVKHLKEFSGYMYKLAQDFLLASSTMEKENKLEKMIEHVSRELPDTAPEWETEKEGN